MERRAGIIMAASFVGAISIAPLQVLIYGSLGFQGSSLVTAALISLPSILFICAALYARYKPRLDFVDLSFFCLLLAILFSFLTNKTSAERKDIILLILTVVLAYPSGRVIQFCQIGVIRLYCFWVSAGILIFGTTATLYTLLSSPWGNGRPLVFGFGHAVNVLSLSLGYFAICSIYQIQRWKSPTGFWTVVLLALSAFIFATSLVRFALIATAAAIVLGLTLPPRKFNWLYILVFSISVGAGLAAQSNRASIMLGYIVELPKQEGDTEIPKHEGAINPTSTSRSNLNTAPTYLIPPPDISQQQAAMPSCILKVNLKNSVVIREVLYLDAFALAPTAGFFGYGLGSFSRMSCLPGHEVHNLLLQAIVEFGWFGGISFFMLLAIPFWRLFPLARKDADAAFMFTLFGFIVLIDMVHGGLNRELPLFVSIGAVVGILASRDAWPVPRCVK